MCMTCPVNDLVFLLASALIRSYSCFGILIDAYCLSMLASNLKTVGLSQSPGQPVALALVVLVLDVLALGLAAL